MPLLTSGADKCVLRAGTYTLGGRGADALPFAPLAWQPAVAMLVVHDDGPVLLRRTSAAVVVRMNGEALGISGVELPHGAQIEFGGCRFAYDATVVSEVENNAVGTHAAATPVTEPGHALRAVGARLVDARTMQAVELSGRRVVIGRGDGCDIVVESKLVSRRHASITPVQGGYELRDESSNGTVVNGTRVGGTCLLSHGDVISMDDVELRVELNDVDGPPRRASAAAATELLDLSRLIGDASVADFRRAAARTVSATLEIVRGSFAGASFQLDKAVCSIGRGEQSDVRVRDDSVSSSHASLLRKGSTWFVIDLRSVNGTFVDGYRIAGERELPAGATLRVGAVEMLFKSYEGGVEVPPRKQRGAGLLRWIASVLRPPVGEAA